MAADSTISSLPAATLPLTGNENVPFDQSGTTVFTTILQIKKDRVSEITTGASITPDSDNSDYYRVKELNINAVVNLPNSALPYTSQKLRLEINDNGVARTLTFDAAYRTTTTLPTQTHPTKTIYIDMIYNGSAGTWDIIWWAETL
jgi:hypothetical protein